MLLGKYELIQVGFRSILNNGEDMKLLHVSVATVSDQVRHLVLAMMLAKKTRNLVAKKNRWPLAMSIRKVLANRLRRQQLLRGTYRGQGR